MTTNGDAEILDRIQKLLTLGESDNEHESALAIARAQALMERHRITMADVVGAEAGEKVAEFEVMVGLGGSKTGRLKRRVGWHGFLAGTIARANGCFMVWAGPKIFIAGCESDVKAAMAMRSFCQAEIDRLTAKFAAGQGRAWGVAFRNGCVDAIGAAIREEQAALREELRGTVTETALVIVNTRATEARGYFGKLGTSNLSSGSDYSGRAAGRAAGTNIYSGTKARVSAPRRRLEG